MRIKEAVKPQTIARTWSARPKKFWIGKEKRHMAADWKTFWEAWQRVQYAVIGIVLSQSSLVQTTELYLNAFHASMLLQVKDVMHAISK